MPEDYCQEEAGVRRNQSGGGPPQSKTLARPRMPGEPQLAAPTFNRVHGHPTGEPRQLRKLFLFRVFCVFRGCHGLFQVRRARLLLGICLTGLALVCGCRKSAQETAEQKAIERHEQEARQRKAFIQAVRGPGAAQMIGAFRFLAALGDSGHLPGISSNESGELISEKHAITPKGPYFFTQEFQIATHHSPPRQLTYVIVQTYSNGDFQLLKASRADASGKVVEAYPVKPEPAVANRRVVFLGPANGGAESGLAEWYNGVQGGGTVSIDHEHPARGYSDFVLGITNAAADQTNHADLRSAAFSLGAAAKTHRPITLSFAYELPDKVKPGDNLDIHFRFFGPKEGAFLGEERILIGSRTADSEMAQYKTLTVTNLYAPAEAVSADLWVVANIFDPWTSGTAHFDDFSVTLDSPPNRTRLVAGAGAFAGLIALLIWTQRRIAAAKPKPGSGRFPSPQPSPQGRG